MAGLLLCIIAIIIGFSYPESRKPDSFNVYMSAGALLLSILASFLMGLTASIHLKAGMRTRAERLRAAITYAWLRKASWLMVLTLYTACVHLYDLPYLVRSEQWLGLGGIPLVPSLLVLLPFFMLAASNLAGLYGGDRLLRGSTWGLWQYEAFYMRQFLVPVFPFLAFSTAYDMLQYFPGAQESLYVYPPLLTVTYAVFILVLFTFAPLLFRLLWKVEPLPEGPLRARFEEMAASSGVKYRDICVWHTGGSNIANAMVTGVFAPMRYIFVTDALLALLPEDEVAAVLAHELGHAKHRHMQIYLVLAVSFIAFINSADQEIGSFLVLLGKKFDVSIGILITAYAFGILIVFWGVIFGFTSRRFEQAADVFAARKVSPATFGSSLARIGHLSGGSRTMSSWRHFSIDKRVRFMEEAAAGGGLDSFRRSMRAAFGVVGAVVLLGACAFLYDTFTATRPRRIYERRLSYVWHMEKDYRRAASIAAGAIRSYPQEADYYSDHATALEKLQYYEKAQAAILEAIRLDPDKDYFYYQHAGILTRLDRIDEALSALLKAIELDPNEEEYRRELGKLIKKIHRKKRQNGPLPGNGD